MSYILYISKVNPPKQEVIDRLIRIHQTPQDSVTVTEYSEKLDNGFKIERADSYEIPKTAKPELKDFLNIKEYKFATTITAKENDEKNKREQGIIK